MAQALVAPIVPHVDIQGEAAAGSSAAVFTATDRKIIQERAGEINRSRSFVDILKEKPLTPEVENEETSVKPQPDVKELAGRKREHKRMLKHSTLYFPQERVEITNTLPDSYKKPAEGKLAKETAALAQKLRLNPADVFDSFVIEQKELLTLISRIHDLHLKRLLTEDENEFNHISEKIIQETISATKPEARAWLKAQLDKLTLYAAEYKLNFLKSLQSLETSEQHKKTIKWLNKIICRIASK